MQLISLTVSLLRYGTVVQSGLSVALAVGRDDNNGTYSAIEVKKHLHTVDQQQSTYSSVWTENVNILPMNV